MSLRSPLYYVITLLFSIVAVLGGESAITVTPMAFGGDFFSLLDKNEDGVLSGREAAFFKPYGEATKGGEITRQEFDAAVASQQDRVAAQDRAIFGDRDGNHDARLSGTEIAGFEFTDLDGDGRIPLAEFLKGMASSRNALGAMTPEELENEATRRFHLIDINKDNMLTGTEGNYMASFDVNEDSRITLAEFIYGTFLDAASSSRVPAVTPLSSEPIQMVIDFVNRQDSVGLIAKLRPELKQILDGVLIDFTLRLAANSHGRISLPSKDSIVIKAGEEVGSQQYDAKPECERGSLSIEVLMFDGAILGFVLESPEVNKLNSKLFDELVANKNGILKSFGEFYSPQCQTMIRHIFANEDAAAIDMFHPETQEKGSKLFANIFARMRSLCGEVISIELETVRIEFDSSGKGEFLNIEHQVVGRNGPMLITHKMQFVGLKGHLVSIKGEQVKVTKELPQATQPTAPISKNAAPVPSEPKSP